MINLEDLEKKINSELTTKIKVALTELQRAWLSRAQLHNHLAYIALGSPAGVYITDDTTLKQVSHTQLIQESIPRKEFINRIELVCSKKETIGLL